MLCSRIRTALSARLDGEHSPPEVTDRQLADHLAGCAACRAWEAQARRLKEATARLAGNDGAAEGNTDTGGTDAGVTDTAVDALLASLRAHRQPPPSPSAGPDRPSASDERGRQAG